MLLQIFNNLEKLFQVTYIMPIPFNVPHLTLNTSDKMPLVGLGTSKVRTKKILEWFYTK